MNIITDNPYRILGVYANSPRRDIVANKGKATAFLKVNKSVEYSLDLSGILPPLSRTLDMMNEAESHLAIASEQIKYAQFWFIKITPIDDIAFNHLLAGNMDDAKEIWSKKESVSSLQNKIVCYLIENKPWLAIKTAEKLYEKYGASYISAIYANSTLPMTPIELLHQFIDSLSEEIGIQKLLNYEMGEDTKAYIRRLAVDPLIKKISSEVDKTNKVDHGNPRARINAAKNLELSTKEPLKQLKSLLPSSDPQLQMIADKLGLEILQCSIDYFNHSDDDLAPHNAIAWLRYAQSIVMGTLAKQRCEENEKILQKIIDELPPKEVVAADKNIKSELSTFVKQPDTISYAVALLHNTRPHLTYIRTILGQSDSYYLKLSTLVVKNALHNVIEEVNAMQSDPEISVRLKLGMALDPISIDRMKSVVRQAWNAILLMDEFDMEIGFKSHYDKNRDTLMSMCKSLGVPTSSWGMATSPPSNPTPFTTSPSKGNTGNDNTGCIIFAAISILSILAGIMSI